MKGRDISLKRKRVQKRRGLVGQEADKEDLAIWRISTFWKVSLDPNPTGMVRTLWVEYSQIRKTRNIAQKALPIQRGNFRCSWEARRMKRLTKSAQRMLSSKTQVRKLERRTRKRDSRNYFLIVYQISMVYSLKVKALKSSSYQARVLDQNWMWRVAEAMAPWTRIVLKITKVMRQTWTISTFCSIKRR